MLLKDMPEHFAEHILGSGIDTIVRYRTAKIKLTYTFLIASDKTRVSLFFPCFNWNYSFAEQQAVYTQKKNTAPFVKLVA